MELGWTIPKEARDYISHMEKRLSRLERNQGSPLSLLDTLGPGIAAQAVQIMDWNAQEATLNGFYHTAPGAVNTPDNGISWTGQTIAKDDGTGMQQVWNTDGPTSAYWMRTYVPTPTADGNVVFGPWKKFATASGFIGTDELDQEVIDAINAGGGSDGNEPVSSPEPEVIGGIGAFFLRWVPPVNADPLRFEVHVSDTSGFTPSSTTLYTETSGYSTTIRNLVTLDPETGEPEKFEYGRDYYFKIVAKDADGPAPASTEASAEMVQINSPDIAASSIMGENIHGSTITGDLFSSNVTLSSTFSTGALDDEGNIVGARIDLGPAGLEGYQASGEPIFKFPLTATETAYLRAKVDLLVTNVYGNFTMFGTNNRLAMGAKLGLDKGVVPPTGEVEISYSYDTLQLDTTTVVSEAVGSFALNPSQITSIAWCSEWGGYYAVAQQRSDGLRVWRFNNDGTLKVFPDTEIIWVDDWTNVQEGRVCADHTGAPARLVHNPTNGIFYVWGKTPGGTAVINTIPSSWINTDEVAAGRYPMLGFDDIADAYVLLQNRNDTGSDWQTIRRFVCSSTSFGPATNVSLDTSANGTGLKQEFNGFYYGADITGSTIKYAYTSTTGTVVRVQNTDGTWADTSSNYLWWTLAAGGTRGFTFNGTQFVTADSNGLLYFYEDWAWPEGNHLTYIGLSAFDSDPAGLSTGTAAPHAGQTAGTHETPIGANFTVTAQTQRAKMIVQVPETNDTGASDDADKWRLYYYRGAAAPTLASDFDLFGEIGSPTAPTTVTLTGDPTGVAPAGGIEGTVGAVNNFPGGTASRIESAGLDAVLDALIQIVGDGSWRMGDLSGDVDGKVVDAALCYQWFNTTTTPTVGTSSWTTRAGWSEHANSTPFGDGFSVGGGGVFTCVEPGIYTITASLAFASNATGRRNIRIALNGSNIVGQGYGSPAGGPSGADVSGQCYCAVGDTIEIQGWQNSGGNLAWDNIGSVQLVRKFGTE